MWWKGGGKDIENKKRKKSPSANLVRSNWIGWEMTWGLEEPSTEASRVIIASIPSEMSSLLLFFSPFSSVGFFIRRQRRNGRRSSFFFFQSLSSLGLSLGSPSQRSCKTFRRESKSPWSFLSINRIQRDGPPVERRRNAPSAIRSRVKRTKKNWLWSSGFSWREKTLIPSIHLLYYPELAAAAAAV